MKNRVFNAVRRGGKWIVVASSTVAGTAMAAVDTTAVDTSLAAAQSSGEAVGATVIGVVAALAVVGVIIGLVKKV